MATKVNRQISVEVNFEPDILILVAGYDYWMKATCPWTWPLHSFRSSWPREPEETSLTGQFYGETMYYLKNSGILNSESLSLGDLAAAGKFRDKKGTFCSSHRCAGALLVTKGRLVYVGESYRSTCPDCGLGSFILHDTVTPGQAARFFSRRVA